MHARRSSPPRSHTRGFSLVEVLVSILVLSIGLLGMVGMQGFALQANREARLQSVAYGLAQELAEMMRGNKDVANLATGSPYRGNFASSPLAPTTAAYCLLAGCTAASGAIDRQALANAQMTEWLARVDQELPGARVTVCLDAAPYASDGLPRWACTAATGSTPAQLFIKIGWSMRSTNMAAPAASAIVRTPEGRPALVFPVIAGSTT